jgi:hypothetical protein
MFNPVQLGSNFARNAIIRYAPLAVGLMTIEHLFRSTAPAVGLKPSAMECKARLRGLWRIMYSKTIRPRPGKAKPARAPRHTGATPAYPGMRAGRPRPQAYRRDAREPRHAGEMPVHPGTRARRLHTQEVRGRTLFRIARNIPERLSVALAGKRPTESRSGIRAGRRAPGSACTSETGWHLRASSRSFR